MFLMLENYFKVESIKKIGDLITRCKRAGAGLGEFLFDKEMKS